MTPAPALRAACEEFFGAAPDVVITADGPAGPGQLEVLCFSPPPGARPSDDFTTIVTVGLSAVELPGQPHRDELGMEVRGRGPAMELEQWSHSLARLALRHVARRPRADGVLHPAHILDDVELAPFHRMRCVLVAPWSTVSHQFLTGTPAVALLRATAVYPSEAAMIRQWGPIAGIARLKGLRTRLEDPQRTPAL